MSLENKIEVLTATIAELIVVLKSQQSAPVAPAPVAVVAPAAPVAPVVTAPVMPPLPTFASPAPVVSAVANAPFNDAKGLLSYVMASFKELGPQKGAAIQNVLTGIGATNVNDVRADQYDALFKGIEELKGK